MAMVPVTTPACMLCGRTSTVEVSAEGYDEWKRGAMVQDAFPEEPADLREMLKTGIHPDCWDEICGEED